MALRSSSSVMPRLSAAVDSSTCQPNPCGRDRGGRTRRVRSTLGTCLLERRRDGIGLPLVDGAVVDEAAERLLDPADGDVGRLAAPASPVSR
jgi:hypothetical protein